MSKKSKGGVMVTENGDSIYHPQMDDSEVGAPNGEPAKPKETKRQRFVRLANRRVPKAIKALQQCANLLRKAQYDYREDEGEKIIELLSQELSAMRVLLKGAAPVTPKLALFGDTD